MLKGLELANKTLSRFRDSEPAWYKEVGMDSDVVIITYYGEEADTIVDSKNIAEVSNLNDLFDCHCKQISSVLSKHKGEVCLVRNRPNIKAFEGCVRLRTRLYFGKPSIV